MGRSEDLNLVTEAAKCRLEGRHDLDELFVMEHAHPIRLICRRCGASFRVEPD